MTRRFSHCFFQGLLATPWKIYALRLPMEGWTNLYSRDVFGSSKQAVLRGQDNKKNTNQPKKPTNPPKKNPLFFSVDFRPSQKWEKKHENTSPHCCFWISPRLSGNESRPSRPFGLERKHNFLKGTWRIIPMRKLGDYTCQLNGDYTLVFQIPPEKVF